MNPFIPQSESVKQLIAVFVQKLWGVPGLLQRSWVDELKSLHSEFDEQVMFSYMHWEFIVPGLAHVSLVWLLLSLQSRSLKQVIGMHSPFEHKPEQC